ncbi:hypothetical protein PMW_123 [Pseudomonas phage phiPMW]|uniref:DUF5681 domain-containing protein n=1 Tax=Pseudomonas phage phiPMW TaxID=1815582 RepID=A0A1S5R1K4_9CAUD|nr:hypothetical protein FDG97_gp227 [Pseudomonas phage phiPMW]ANA49248.1 hypothetical protein PMW_123 [Pseudomonas phage phiPMW]
MYEEDEDVGESPLHAGHFKPGQSGNPAGRPKGTKNKPRSKMRVTLEKLYTIQDDAIETIRHELTGKDKDGNPVKAPPKTKVDMAKFVVKAIESYNNTCLAEETKILNVKKDDPQGAEQLTENQQDKPIQPGFSLSMSDESA